MVQAPQIGDLMMKKITFFWLLLATTQLVSTKAAHAWYACGFRAVLTSITLKKHPGDGKNRVNKVKVRVLTSSDFGQVDLSQKIAIHRSFVGKPVIFYTKPTAGHFFAVAVYECFKDNKTTWSGFKDLPSELNVIIEKVNIFSNDEVANLTAKLTDVYGYDKPVVVENDAVKVTLTVTRVNGLVNTF